MGLDFQLSFTLVILDGQVLVTIKYALTDVKTLADSQ